MPVLDVEPAPSPIDPETTALIVVDMQRDFPEPGGFVESLGNDVSLFAAAVPPTRALLAAARDAGLLVVHRREGHASGHSDAPPAKRERGARSLGRPERHRRR